MLCAAYQFINSGGAPAHFLSSRGRSMHEAPHLQSMDRLPYRLSKLVQEDVGEKWNVSGALAQRREVEDHPGQPEVQVLAKPSPPIRLSAGRDWLRHTTS